MKGAIQTLFALGAIHLAAAAPSGTSFSVPRVRRNGTTLNGKLALQRVFAKYGWTLPDGPPADVHNTVTTVFANTPQTGSVNADPQQYHAEYLSPVTIGGQELQLDFDSGSSDLWVFSTYLAQSDIGPHTAFNPNQSRSFSPLPGQHWTISYGDGSGAAGVVGADNVAIGAATVTKQAVEMATAISSEFVQDSNNDGLVGLGFNPINNGMWPKHDWRT